MNKRIFRNNYFEINLNTAIIVGIVYEDESIYLAMGFIFIEIKLYGFNRKKKPQSF
jgi:hypothetical protein